MRCASCGSMIPDNAMFCPGCGQRLLSQRRTAVTNGENKGQTPAVPAPASRATIPREELGAAIAAREELGARMEPEIIDTFLDRIEHAIDLRIDERIRQRAQLLRGPTGRARLSASQLTGRIAASLALGIPLTAVAGGIAEGGGILATWLGIIGLNVFYTWIELKDDRRDG